MPQKKSPRNQGGVKLEPLKGQFFDIKPAKVGKGAPELRSYSDFFRFALTAFLAFTMLTVGNAFVQGRELAEVGQESAYAGYESLKQGMDSLIRQDVDGASQYFSKAQAAFSELDQSTRHLTIQANAFTSQNLYLDTANSLLESALEVSEIGQELSVMAQTLHAMPATLLSGDESVDVMALVHQKRQDVAGLLSRAASLQRKLTTLNLGLIPAQLEGKIRLAQGQIGTFIAALLEIEDNFDVLLTLLGDEVPHRYLILLQNNHERRATGGFIGSYMIVDVNDGKITKMQAKDVYESDGQLAKVVSPPPGIDQVATKLHMRDANYSPDFPTAAQEVMWFLEHSKGPSADTVIAIDPTLVEQIIALTGPLRLPSLPFQVTAENFTDLVSFHTEAKITSSATPKQLLFDLIPAFTKHLESLTDIESLVSAGQSILNGGHLQIYSKDPQIQALSQRFGTSGQMLAPAPKTDYLAVVTTAIGGNKSDQYIDQNIIHRTEVVQNGTLINEVAIKKTHTWGQAQATNLENLMARYGTGKLTKEALYFILGRGPNVDYMRVYVPLGSHLQSVSGVDLSEIQVSEDLGYTVFGFTFGPVNAGQSEEVALRYQLPFELSMNPVDNYRFIAQNQAGAENITLRKEVLTAEGLTVAKSYPAPTEAFSLNPVYETALDRTQIFISAIQN